MKYDFNKRNELLQIDDYEDIYDFISEFTESIENLRKYESVTVYGKAKFIEKILLLLHGFRFDSNNRIALSMIDFDGDGLDYDGEYVLAIDHKYKLWIEPCRNRNGKLIASEEILAYCYQEDIKQDLIDFLGENEIPTLLFGLEKI